jgi:RNA polymerase sigma factor (TIGR02999 family)
MTEYDEGSRISVLLGRASAGEPGALARVFDAAYPDLCALASVRLRKGGAAPAGLDTSMLVHEVFVRLAQRNDLQAQHRGPFFKYAGRVMHSVIVDAIRERAALRRGGEFQHEALQVEDEAAVPWVDDDEVREVQRALHSLAAAEPALWELIYMRFFGGLTDEEIATALGVSDRTVRRRWERARSRLLELLGE